MAGSPLRSYHNDPALRIATAGVCLHVISSRSPILTPRAAIWNCTVSRWYSIATKPAFFAVLTKMRLAVAARRSSARDERAEHHQYLC